MTIKTVSSRITAVAAADGYCSSEISLEINRPTLARCDPDMNRTVMKSPITSVTTKIVPIMMPGLVSGRITWRRVWNPLAPLSRAASSSDPSIRIIVLKIGTTMNSV